MSEKSDHAKDVYDFLTTGNPGHLANELAGIRRALERIADVLENSTNRHGGLCIMTYDVDE